MLYSSQLHNAELFKGLTDKELVEISKLVLLKDLKNGATLFREGTKGEEFYILMKGKIGVNIKGDEDVDEIQIATVSNGETVGEFILVDEEVRSASAVCIENSSFLVLSKEKLLNLFKEKKEIGYKIMRNLATILCDRLKTTNMRWRNSILYFSVRSEKK